MFEPQATIVPLSASHRRVDPGLSVAQAPSFSTVDRARTHDADLRDDRHSVDKHTCISVAMRSPASAIEVHPEAESASRRVRLPRAVRGISAQVRARGRARNAACGPTGSNPDAPEYRY